MALLIGAAWFAKKLSGGRGFGQSGIKVIGGVVLGPRERIVLLEIGQERLVIGIVPGQIRTLHRLAAASEPSESTEPTQVSLPEKPFKQWLQTFIEQRKNV